MRIAIQLSLIHVHSILSHRMSAASDVQPCFIKLSIFTILVPGSFPRGLPAFVFLYTLDQTSIIKVLMTGHRIKRNHRIYNCLVRKVIGCWLHVYPAFKTFLSASHPIELNVKGFVDTVDNSSQRLQYIQFYIIILLLALYIYWIMYIFFHSNYPPTKPLIP